MTGPVAEDGARLLAPDPVRFQWPDRQDELARVLPVLVRFDDVELVVAPGELVVVPLRRFTVVAVPPGAAPLVAEVDRSDTDILVLPFTIEEVVAACAVPAPAAKPRGTVVFGLGTWTTEPAGTAEFAVARHRDGLSVAPGRDEISNPAWLEVAARTTPTRVVAVPTLAPGEKALVDLAVERPFGSRPALLPSDTTTRLLLAYLGAGEFRIAGQMARRLAAVRAAERPVAWSEPSLAQLVVGYSLAAAGDGPRLAAWCRRTRAVWLLGVDGIVLAATAAWRQGRADKAARLLARAGQTGPPVMSLGLEWAVRLAFQLQARGHQPEELDRLVTAYSVVSASSDPLADTVTKPESPRRPLSLERRSFVARARWALAYLAVKARLPYAIRSTEQVVQVVLSRSDRRPGASMSKQNPPLKADEVGAVAGRFGRSTSLRRYQFLLIVIFLTFLAAVAASFVLVSAPRDVLAALAVPFSLLWAALFTFLGVAITLTAGPDRDKREHELRQRAVTSERRANEAAEAAMKGLALAAALQADARTEPSLDSKRHARLSRSLFGDLIGDDPGEEDS